MYQPPLFVRHAFLDPSCTLQLATVHRGSSSPQPKHNAIILSGGIVGVDPRGTYLGRYLHVSLAADAAAKAAT